MMSWTLVAMAMTAVPLYGHLVVTGRRTSPAFALGVMFSAALPWLLPSDEPIARLFVAVWAISIGFRMADVAYGRYPCPEMLATVPRAVFTFVLGPDGRWPHSASEAARNRRAGRMRIGRAVAKQVPAIGLLALGTAWPQMHQWVLVEMFWLLWLTYFVATASFDILCGIGMLVAGVWAAECFDVPPLATSPRDFWSRRWNLLFRTQVHRHIFTPLGGGARPVLGVVAVFAFSALVHEYIVIASLGTTGGHMTVFFALHGAATLAYGAWWRRRGRPPMPRVLAVPTHLVWFTATAYFFFTPMLEILPVHEIRLW